jgi:hypothetical protein
MGDDDRRGVLLLAVHQRPRAVVGALAGGQLDHPPFGLGGEELEQPCCLLLHGRRLGEGVEGLHDEGGGAPLLREAPDPAEEPVDQQRGPVEVVGGPAGGGVGGDAGAVGVTQQDVVVLGEEAGRGRGVGVGVGGVGEVEQLAAGGVAEGAQAGAEAVGDLAQAVRPDQAWTSMTVAGPKAAR